MQHIHDNISDVCLENRNGYRNHVELLRSRVNLLGGSDKALMTMYLDNGNTFYQMAQLAGVNETTISRRIKRVTKRLMEGEYIECIRNRDKFSRFEMNLAKQHFLMGLALKEIADREGITYYKARETIQSIKQRILRINRLG